MYDTSVPVQVLEKQVCGIGHLSAFVPPTDPLRRLSREAYLDGDALDNVRGEDASRLKRPDVVGAAFNDIEEKPKEA